MGKKSKYDLFGAQMVKIPQSIWERLVKEFGVDAAEQARDCLDLCAGVENE